MIVQGDAMHIPLADQSVQCVVTSPPYSGLRSYGFKADDPARKKMIGMEPTFDRHLWNLVRVFREVRRVLRDDGTVWLNYGDSYDSGTRTLRRPSESAKGKHGYWTNPNIENRNRTKLGAKNLIGMAWRVAFALQADGWYLRSDIIWHKRSPMPESVRDRPTKAHEYVFLLTKRPSYFYDQEAGREPQAASTLEHFKSGVPRRANRKAQASTADEIRGNESFRTLSGIIGGRNMRDVWTLSTEPYAGAHFATFPTELVARCLRPGTSAKGCCRECGVAWRRITERERRATRPGSATKVRAPSGWDIGAGAHGQKGSDGRRPAGECGNRDEYRHVTDYKTVGWHPGCGHGGDPVPCRVLDPFAGSGTVGVACRRMGLDFIGLELSEAYCQMGRARISGCMDERAAPSETKGQLEMAL